MLPESALGSMNVLVATPCYASNVSMHYVASMFQLAGHATALGLHCGLHLHSESLITRSRNRIVAHFLANPDYTHLFWIDSDIAFDPRFVLRLLLSDRDVVAGVYPKKEFHWPVGGPVQASSQQEFEDRYSDFTVTMLDGAADKLGARIDSEGFLEVDLAPTGFMAVKREVFTRLIASYPELNYTPDDPAADKRHHWLFYDCMVDPATGTYLSEDYAFCRRWRAIGGRVWLDVACDLGHLGHHHFTGGFARSLRLNNRL